MKPFFTHHPVDSALPWSQENDRPEAPTVPIHQVVEIQEGFSIKGLNQRC